ncbi:hypothetical protein [Loigolactobacillus coryniformis]|uniref:hypothetical protein n=1 Tax=Loigolactobacillus coryniformis TaxID=1610 RepID=UPI001F020564|nr:hypothetical protein [Loigolactobacillus coryniformis]
MTIVRKSQKTELADCRQRNRLEAKGYAGARSTIGGEVNQLVGETKLMDAILKRNNLNAAYLRIKRNKGVAGIDGISIKAMLPYLKEHRESLIKAVRTGHYQTKPVKRVQIPKPNGGQRKLGNSCGY